MTLFWRRELDYLKKQCDDRAAPELPPVVCEWFDLNRGRVDSRHDQAYLDALGSQIAAVAADFKMDDWRFHTDAFGWRLLLQPYTRGGSRYYLLCVTRETKPGTRDLAKLNKLVIYLGADPEDDFLMSTRLDDDPDVQDFWTWTARRSAS